MQTNPYLRFFSFFGLRENPFTVSPDPRYLVMSRQMREAWEALEYGIESREGIIVLTGEAGTGKTTLVNRLLEWLRERGMPTAFIFNSHLEPRHLFDFMLADFGVKPKPQHNGSALMCLSEWLPERCREGQFPVLIVDEAQGLPVHVLEEIRLLLNLETPHEKLLQIVLAGQPELEETLKRPGMRQLKQRIALRCRTRALTQAETHEYVQERLNVAGASGHSIFTPAAIDAVHAYSRGIPRVMNLLCEHALINAYAGNIREVPALLVEDVALEFQFDPEAHAPPMRGKTARNLAVMYDDLLVTHSPVTEASLAPALAVAPSAAELREIPPASAFVEMIQPLVAAETSDLQVADDFPAALSAPGETVAFPVVESPQAVASRSVLARPAPAQPMSTQAVSAQSESAQSESAQSVSAQSESAHALSAIHGSGRAAKPAREVNMVRGRQMIAKVGASWPPVVRTSMIRARAIETSRHVWESLRHACERVFDGRAAREACSLWLTAAASKVAVVRRELSAALSRRGGTRQVAWQGAWQAAWQGGWQAWQGAWREAAPTWQRAKKSWVHWLKQPLGPRRRSAEAAGNGRITSLWAGIEATVRLNRGWQESRDKFLAVVPAARHLRIKEPVGRWLRQPIRPSQLLHSGPRTASQRNRVSSAL